METLLSKVELKSFQVPSQFAVHKNKEKCRELGNLLNYESSQQHLRRANYSAVTASLRLPINASARLFSEIQQQQEKTHDVSFTRKHASAPFFQQQHSPSRAKKHRFFHSK
jgi:hypothetical protein